MKALLTAGALALSAGAAQAQEDYGLTLTIVDADAEGYVGQLVHHNRYTNGIAPETFHDFETVRGTFTVRLLTTPNRECPVACPDVVELWDWPEDISPTALEVETPELGVSVIRLFEYRGV